MIRSFESLIRGTVNLTVGKSIHILPALLRTETGCRRLCGSYTTMSQPTVVRQPRWDIPKAWRWPTTARDFGWCTACPNSLTCPTRRTTRMRTPRPPSNSARVSCACPWWPTNWTKWVSALRDGTRTKRVLAICIYFSSVSISPDSFCPIIFKWDFFYRSSVLYLNHESRSIYS